MKQDRCTLQVWKRHFTSLVCKWNLQVINLRKTFLRHFVSASLVPPKNVASCTRQCTLARLNFSISHIFQLQHHQFRRHRFQHHLFNCAKQCILARFALLLLLLLLLLLARFAHHFSFVSMHYSARSSLECIVGAQLNKWYWNWWRRNWWCRDWETWDIEKLWDFEMIKNNSDI